MQFLLDFIRDQLAHNQLFTGGAVLMVGGAILHYCRMQNDTPEKAVANASSL